jgi:hypothetical protein
MRLADVLSQRAYWRRLRPFPHVVAADVFEPGLAGALWDAFRERLDRGLSSPGPADPEKFARRVPGYGAHVLNLGPATEGPFEVFLSRPWRDMLAGLFGVEATLDVDVALHHHEVGSPTGWVHNDLNPGFFVDRPRADGVNASDAGACDYQQGTLISGSGPVRETVRAVAVLYYLGAEVYEAGDGGETGLYVSARDRADDPAAMVAPVPNSLLAFECTPWSYHAFLSNRRKPRSCVAMWVHRRKEEVVRRWGERSIERWPGS